MRPSAPALAPIFRSLHQLEILGQIFVVSDAPQSITAISEATGVPGATVSREISRLLKSKIVSETWQGRNRLVAANWDLPWSFDLARLLAKTIGPLGVIGRLLTDHQDEIVDAWVYGSWAERYEGTAGSFPRDVDVLVVGDIDLQALYDVAATAERELGTGVQINPIVVSARDWAERDNDPLLSTVSARSLVPIPIGPQHDG